MHPSLSQNTAKMIPQTKNLLNFPQALSEPLTVFIALASSSLALLSLTTDSQYQSELRVQISEVITEEQS